MELRFRENAWTEKVIDVKKGMPLEEIGILTWYLNNRAGAELEARYKLQKDDTGLDLCQDLLTNIVTLLIGVPVKNVRRGQGLIEVIASAVNATTYSPPHDCRLSAGTVFLSEDASMAITFRGEQIHHGSEPGLCYVRHHIEPEKVYDFFVRFQDAFISPVHDGPGKNMIICTPDGDICVRDPNFPHWAEVLRELAKQPNAN